MVMYVDSKASSKHPVALTAHLDPGLSRWQWLVKWFLAIPHYLILVFLWPAFLVVTVIAGFCILFGTHVPFSDARLSLLYRNHGAYVSSVAHATNDNLKAGYIVAADAEADKQAAADSDIGKK